MCVYTGISLQQEILLSPSPVAEVIEGRNLTLTCSYSGSHNVSRVVWSNNMITPCTVLTTDCSSCRPNSSMYEAECMGNDFLINILAVNRSMNGDVWKCDMRIGLDFLPSKKTTVKVLVGINAAALWPETEIVIIENTLGYLHCLTSFGKPTARISWFQTNATGDVNITSLSTSEMISLDGLSAVNSTLLLQSLREMGTFEVYCSAENIGQHFKSLKTTVEVLYGPDTPACTHKGSIITGCIIVTQGDNLTIECTSNSNPASVYNWTLPDSSTRYGGKLKIINIQPSLSGQYRLKVWNIMSPTNSHTQQGNNSTILTVDVQDKVPSTSTQTDQSLQTGVLIGSVIGACVVGILAGVIATLGIQYMRSLSSRKAESNQYEETQRPPNTAHKTDVYDSIQHYQQTDTEPGNSGRGETETMELETGNSGRGETDTMELEPGNSGRGETDTMERSASDVYQNQIIHINEAYEN
ncbi:hypothetical protein DPMN_151695 [Dreissena polymorpha]|uniref:Ig-like domain-containing protein n=1 Tax=Dreissena polymorpha TaxID=45954 RepID=A0A9D4FKH0_DREPO|nr:hypothetical protein DPMN_151695 [Dreissena polymorpha]